MYTIGQVSEMFHLPISTLRYYDKEGFFPNLVRKGNIRYFSDNELEALRIIECLKRSGLEIKDIKQFFKWVADGASTYAKRKELFCLFYTSPVSTFKIDVIKLSVKDVTIPENAPPMITPIAISITFPRRANALVCSIPYQRISHFPFFSSSDFTSGGR